MYDDCLVLNRTWVEQTVSKRKRRVRNLDFPKKAENSGFEKLLIWKSEILTNCMSVADLSPPGKEEMELLSLHHVSGRWSNINSTLLRHAKDQIYNRVKFNFLLLYFNKTVRKSKIGLEMLLIKVITFYSITFATIVMHTNLVLERITSFYPKIEAVEWLLNLRRSGTKRVN